MFTYISTLKVRYAETDQMGVVHHGNYASYLELARLEWLENIGFSYKKLEAQGVTLPVYEINFSFNHPAYFDDILTVETRLASMPGARIIFNYKILNSDQKLITSAQSTLVFMDVKTRRPIRCPKPILDRLKEGSL